MIVTAVRFSRVRRITTTLHSAHLGYVSEKLVFLLSERKFAGAEIRLNTLSSAGKYHLGRYYPTDLLEANAGPRVQTGSLRSRSVGIGLLR
jgi:hypothetical protein